MSSLEDLDDMFDLSEEITSDPKLRAMHEILLQRVLKECKHLQMQTMQLMLIERLVTGYVVLRAKEKHALGSLSGFSSTATQKGFNSYWLTMTRELNAQMQLAAKTNRQAFLEEVIEMIKDSLIGEDPDVRERLLLKFASRAQEARL